MVKNIIVKFVGFMRRVVANICIFNDPNPLWRKDFYKKTIVTLKGALHIDKALVATISKLPRTSLTRHLLSIMKNLSGPPWHSSQRQYRNIIFHLRFALRSKDYRLRRKSSSPPDVALCHRLCLAFYRENRLLPFCRDLIDVIEKESPKRSTSAEAEGIAILEQFDAGYVAVRSAPLSYKTSLLRYFLDSLHGHLGIVYDPNFQINSVQILYDVVVGGKTVTNIRMGTPTREYLSRFQKAEIVPEFFGFLRAYSNGGKRHLYINLQRRRSTFLSDESRRSRALENLNTVFPNTITVVTLDKDSSFYHQRGGYRSFSYTKKFKEEFFQQVTKQKKSRCFFPESIKKKGLDKAFKDIIETVHGRYFDFRSTLGVRERHDFIEIAYLLLQNWLLEVSDVDTFCLACKDGIDRSGAANSLMFFYHNKHDTKKFIKDWKAITFAPALLVKRRSMIASRFDRVITTARRMLFQKQMRG